MFSSSQGNTVTSGLQSKETTFAVFISQIMARGYGFKWLRARVEHIDQDASVFLPSTRSTAADRTIPTKAPFAGAGPPAFSVIGLHSISINNRHHVVRASIALAERYRSPPRPFIGFDSPVRHQVVYGRVPIDFRLSTQVSMPATMPRPLPSVAPLISVHCV